MKRTHLLLILTALLLGLNQSAHAYWPTEVDEALPVSTVSGIMEVLPQAVSFTDGRLVVSYNKEYGGTLYQIVDRFGEFVFEEPRFVFPLYGTEYTVAQIQMISDGQGGFYFIADSQYGLIQGILAQHIDSLGNRLWGDEGLTVFSGVLSSYDVCSDENGGFIVIIESSVAPSDDENIWGQRVDYDGNLLWGNPGAQIAIDPYSVNVLHICSDNTGGCFAVWSSNRVSNDVQLFMQHVDNDGSVTQPLIGPILYLPWYNDIISDGTGGCIIEATNGQQMDHWRFDQNSNQLWYHNGWSWYYNSWACEPVLGEPGYFYLGFYWVDGFVYGQRIDLDGNYYWPTYPPERGAKFNVTNFSTNFGNEADYGYGDLYLHAFWVVHPGSRERHLYMSKLDTNGFRQYGGEEVLMYTRFDRGSINDVKVIPLPDGSAVGVFTSGSNWYPHSDIWAKRVNPDGSLGGPLHLLIDLEPESASIQIPPTGGSFTYNIAIEDTYVVHSDFDAWVEVTLPGGDTREITVREGIYVDSNSVIQRFDLVQNVPAWAPTGDYSYTLYVGDHDYPDWYWSKDEFWFEKVSTGTSRLRRSTTSKAVPATHKANGFVMPDDDPASRAAKLSGQHNRIPHENGWLLSGFFDDMSVEYGDSTAQVCGDSPAPFNQPLTTSHQPLALAISPNPFNAQAMISFDLPQAGVVGIDIFDVTGSRVGVGL
ncbi:hypothetical protein KJ564_14670, partial [bacterium]|nr:hypothetical protein [bacterium]